MQNVDATRRDDSSLTTFTNDMQASQASKHESISENKKIYFKIVISPENIHTQTHTRTLTKENQNEKILKINAKIARNSKTKTHFKNKKKI